MLVETTLNDDNSCHYKKNIYIQRITYDIIINIKHIR